MSPRRRNLARAVHLSFAASVLVVCLSLPSICRADESPAPPPDPAAGFHARRWFVAPTAYAIAPISPTTNQAALGGTIGYAPFDRVAFGLAGNDWLQGPAPDAHGYVVPAPSQRTEARWNLDAEMIVTALSVVSPTRPAMPAFDLIAAMGFGAIVTRPVSVIDAARAFPYEPHFDFTEALGARVFLTRFAALTLEGRFHQYDDQRENTTAPIPGVRYDHYSKEGLTIDLQGGVGLAFWLPAS